MQETKDAQAGAPRTQNVPEAELAVAVLIPCYNNEAVTIGKVVDDFRRVLPEATVYVYDNNSSDGTGRSRASTGPWCAASGARAKATSCAR